MKVLKDDDIHDFRVEIKKFRAFLRLLSFQSGKHQPAITKKIKAFYSCIGMIRNHRLQQNYTSNFIREHQLTMPTTYLQTLDKEEAHWKKQALKLMHGTDFSDDTATIKKKLPNTVTKSAIHQFVKAKLKKLSQYKTSLEDDDTLHSVRKVIKDFQYNWQVIKKHAHLPAGIASIKEIKTLTELICAFMDKEVQASSAQLFNKSSVKGAGELKILQQLATTSQQEKADLKLQVITTIKWLDLPEKKPKHEKEQIAEHKH